MILDIYSETADAKTGLYQGVYVLLQFKKENGFDNSVVTEKGLLYVACIQWRR